MSFSKSASKKKKKKVQQGRERRVNFATTSPLGSTQIQVRAEIQIRAEISPTLYSCLYDFFTEAVSGNKHLFHLLFL